MVWNKALPLTGTDPDPAEITQMWGALETRGGPNLFADPYQLIWPNDAGAPAATNIPVHFYFSGSGAKTCERAGLGLSDPTYYLKRGFTAKLVGGSDVAKYGQIILPAAAFDDYYLTRYLSIGWPVKCGDVEAARIVVDDGNKQTPSAWCGTSGWNWLTVSHQIDPAAATLLKAELQVAAGATAYSGAGMTPIWGEVPPAYFMPSPVVYGTLYFPLPGVIAVGTQRASYAAARPMLIRDVQLFAKTAPTGQALIVDLNTWDGSAFTSMFSTRPQLAISTQIGGAQPDATYARRCMSYAFGAGLPAGSYLTMDIDQVGNVVAGSDLAVHVRAVQYARPHEPVIPYDAIGF